MELKLLVQLRVRMRGRKATGLKCATTGGDVWVWGERWKWMQRDAEFAARAGQVAVGKTGS